MSSFLVVCGLRDPRESGPHLPGAFPGQVPWIRKLTPALPPPPSWVTLGKVFGLLDWPTGGSRGGMALGWTSG